MDKALASCYLHVLSERSALKTVLLAGFILFSISSVVSDIASYRTRVLDLLIGIVGIMLLKFVQAETDWTDTLVGGTVAGLTFFIMYRIGKGKLGMGDVLYSLFAGLACGFWIWDIGVFIAACAGILWLVLSSAKKPNRAPLCKRRLPFIPFMFAGCLAATALQLVVL